MLYLYRSGQAKTRKQAAEMIGVHRKTVGDWLATYSSGGLDALLERAYSTGRPPELTKEQQELLLSELQKPEGFSSYQQITDYIEETFGVKMSYSAVHNLVRYRWNAKLKVPRKSHKKKMKTRVMSLNETSQKQSRLPLHRELLHLKRYGSFAKMSQDLVYCLFHIGVLPYPVSNRLLKSVILMRTFIYMVL